MWMAARAVLSTVLKNGQASTIDVVNGIKNLLPLLREQLPDALKIDVLSDQSLFVKAAINGVVREGVIAAGLTSLMILFFLGSWRSTVIIATSIPLAVLAALMALWATGQTLNIMTLGGLALAVGILVDDATVTIENINWHLEHGKRVYDAIMDGARQITQPAFVSLLCICVAFVPMFSLQGVAGFLFVPMAMAVVFAMIASFILSRTLVPTLALYLLKLACRGTCRAGQQHVRPAAEAFRERLCRHARGLSQPAGAGHDAAPALCVRLSGRRGASPCCWCPSWARTSSPAWIPARSPCMPARPPAPGSRTPPRSWPRSSARSAASFPRTELATIVDNVGLQPKPHQHDLQQYRHRRACRMPTSSSP